MKKNSPQSYKVQYRLKTELKTMNQIPLSPLKMSSLVVVHCTERKIYLKFVMARFLQGYSELSLDWIERPYQI